jgi:hypothetical protein
MTRLERCQLAIEKGYTYDSISGTICNKDGKVISAKKLGYIYIALRCSNKIYELKGHIFAWYYINKEVVECLDHINRKKSDNRINNLRSVSLDENRINNSPKGYTFHKNNKKWISRISTNKESIYLGSFNTEDEAKLSYTEAKKKYHII